MKKLAIPADAAEKIEPDTYKRAFKDLYKWSHTEQAYVWVFRGKTTKKDVLIALYEMTLEDENDG